MEEQENRLLRKKNHLEPLIGSAHNNPSNSLKKSSVMCRGQSCSTPRPQKGSLRNFHETASMTAIPPEGTVVPHLHLESIIAETSHSRRQGDVIAIEHKECYDFSKPHVSPMKQQLKKVDSKTRVFFPSKNLTRLSVEEIYAPTSRTLHRFRRSTSDLLSAGTTFLFKNEQMMASDPEKKSSHMTKMSVINIEGENGPKILEPLINKNITNSKMMRKNRPVPSDKPKPFVAAGCGKGIPGLSDLPIPQIGRLPPNIYTKQKNLGDRTPLTSKSLPCLSQEITPAIPKAALIHQAPKSCKIKISTKSQSTCNIIPKNTTDSQTHKFSSGSAASLVKPSRRPNVPNRSSGILRTPSRNSSAQIDEIHGETISVDPTETIRPPNDANVVSTNYSEHTARSSTASTVELIRSYGEHDLPSKVASEFPRNVERKSPEVRSSQIKNRNQQDVATKTARSRRTSSLAPLNTNNQNIKIVRSTNSTNKIDNKVTSSPKLVESEELSDASENDSSAGQSASHGRNPEPDAANKTIRSRRTSSLVRQNTSNPQMKKSGSTITQTKTVHQKTKLEASVRQSTAPEIYPEPDDVKRTIRSRHTDSRSHNTNVQQTNKVGSTIAVTKTIEPKVSPSPKVAASDTNLSTEQITAPEPDVTRKAMHSNSSTNLTTQNTNVQQRKRVESTITETETITPKTPSLKLAESEEDLSNQSEDDSSTELSTVREGYPEPECEAGPSKSPVESKEPPHFNLNDIDEVSYEIFTPEDPPDVSIPYNFANDFLEVFQNRLERAVVHIKYGTVTECMCSYEGPDKEYYPCLKHLDRHNVQFYAEACKVIEVFSERLSSNTEYNAAENFFKENYPNYYQNYILKYPHRITKEYLIKCAMSKHDFIKASKRVLKEEDLYVGFFKNEDIMGIKRNLIIGGGVKDVEKEFKISFKFIVKEYPSLFVQLIEKYEFIALAFEKLKMIQNRLALIEKATWSSNVLRELDEEYKIEEDPTEDIIVTRVNMEKQESATIGRKPRMADLTMLKSQGRIFKDSPTSRVRELSSHREPKSYIPRPDNVTRETTTRGVTSPTEELHVPPLQLDFSSTGQSNSRRRTFQRRQLYSTEQDDGFMTSPHAPSVRTDLGKLDSKTRTFFPSKTLTRPSVRDIYAPVPKKSLGNSNLLSSRTSIIISKNITASIPNRRSMHSEEKTIEKSENYNERSKRKVPELPNIKSVTSSRTTRTYRPIPMNKPKPFIAAGCGKGIPGLAALPRPEIGRLPLNLCIKQIKTADKAPFSSNSLPAIGGKSKAATPNTTLKHQTTRSLPKIGLPPNVSIKGMKGKGTPSLLSKSLPVIKEENLGPSLPKVVSSRQLCVALPIIKPSKQQSTESSISQYVNLQSGNKFTKKPDMAMSKTQKKSNVPSKLPVIQHLTKCYGKESSSDLIPINEENETCTSGKSLSVADPENFSTNNISDQLISETSNGSSIELHRSYGEHEISSEVLIAHGLETLPALDIEGIESTITSYDLSSRDSGRPEELSWRSEEDSFAELVIEADSSTTTSEDDSPMILSDFNEEVDYSTFSPINRPKTLLSYELMKESYQVNGGNILRTAVHIKYGSLVECQCYFNNPCLKHIDHEKLEFFYEADTVLLVLMENFGDQHKLRSARNFFKVNYPNYYQHYILKHPDHITNDYKMRHTKSKLNFIRACKRVLKEEDIFVELFESDEKIGNRRNLLISGNKENVEEEFITCLEFIVKEYPALFVQLLENLGFVALAFEKLLLYQNGLDIIQKTHWDPENLRELDEEFQIGEDV
ncbi:hypothetical protein HHI36_022977 [Cryptolaemus montrouzieri]|uniref:Uncharacterized protein n=1 Tax=Cryptolaemus montrouzieri TaxID=559131 RepID=A0ABD2PF62_9CUCU